MSNRPFRLGIAGVGLISEQSHIPAALGLPGVELVALIDPVTARAAAAARSFRIAARAAATVAEVADGTFAWTDAAAPPGPQRYSVRARRTAGVVLEGAATEVTLE